MSLGIELNNPGNIRHTTTHWRGQDLTDKGPYCKFESPEWGIRAIAKLLTTYESEGIRTLRACISRWAPPEDGNDTDTYIANVCTWTGMGADQGIELVSLALIKAIIRQEQGSVPYPDSQILLGMVLANPTPET